MGAVQPGVVVLVRFPFSDPSAPTPCGPGDVGVIRVAWLGARECRAAREALHGKRVPLRKGRWPIDERLPPRACWTSRLRTPIRSPVRPC